MTNKPSPHPGPEYFGPFTYETLYTMIRQASFIDKEGRFWIHEEPWRRIQKVRQSLGQQAAIHSQKPVPAPIKRRKRSAHRRY